MLDEHTTSQNHTPTGYQLMTTMLQTLKETATAYTSKTRASNRKGNCYYFKKGKCCAVGRCLEKPEKFAKWDCKVDRLPDLGKNLKPEYRGYPVAFWEALQHLHDHLRFWDEKGLSEDGKKQFEKIKNQFKL